MQRAVLLDQDILTAERLLKAGFNPQAPIGCGTFDSLDGAVYRANPEMVELLLRYGARPNESTFVQAAFLIPFDSAVRIVTEFLQAGADVNSKMRYSENPAKYWTALHQAVWHQNSDLVRLLLAQKDVSLNDIDGDGYSALAIANKNGDGTIADLLLRAGADPRFARRTSRRHVDELASN